MCLREKAGKAHAMPCHHNLEAYMAAYLELPALRDDPKGPLFRTNGRGTRQLTRIPLPQTAGERLRNDPPARRGAAAAEIETKIGNHSFRARGDHRLSQEWRDA